MKKLKELPYILFSERTPIVDQLIDLVKERDDYIKDLEREIKRLKKLPQKPAISPSKLKEPKVKDPLAKRAGSLKAQKTSQLIIDEVHIQKLHEKPAGAVFKGYRSYTVQDIKIAVVNHLFKCERYQAPDGKYLQAELPFAYRGHHFGPQLRAYILHQYYHQGVTQALLWQQLAEWGVRLSKGQLNRLIVEGKGNYHAEKEEVFATGLFLSAYVQVDDTGARHQGRNGYCTYIGNELFAYFRSTESKSRLNFINCLQGKTTGYALDYTAWRYLTAQMKTKAAKLISAFSVVQESARYFLSKEALIAYLTPFRLSQKELNWCCEAASFSYLRKHLTKDLLIISDEAGQFCLPGMKQGLCWVHVERKLKQLVPRGEEEQKVLLSKQTQYWQLYQSLCTYKLKPDEEQKTRWRKAFTELCTPVERYIELNEVLARIKKWEQKLLLVLDYPFLPLHNNTSERDIREYVRKRKISGSTRHANGRAARDTFASLKKTCQKLGVRFWDYLLDRTLQLGRIHLQNLMCQVASRDNDILRFALAAG